MFNLIPISLLIMSLGGFIYIVSNHLSEFSASGDEDEKDEFSFGIRAKLADWLNQLPLDNIKVQSLSLTQKLLHKMRIVILKTDNSLMKLISKISEKEKAAPSDFWKDFSSNNQETSPKQISEPEPEARIDLTFKTNSETEKFFDIKPVKKIKKVRKTLR